ncbi:Siderochrome iron transporter 2 [Paecilomyces lecythidis]|uniref:Siderochrome iron transporter 2 n=1 Tax=Paecilomyces lecythidis TaxID=3004212 RepID=A0ABR3XG04_9EURO
MGVFDLVKGRHDHHLAAAVSESEAPQQSKDDAHVHDHSASDSETLSLEEREAREIEKHPDQITKNAQLGVQKAEAAALVWPKKVVYGAYAWIWVCYFMLALQQSIFTTVYNNAYANFESAPQISTANILGTIIGGVLKLPIAKSLNIWGRTESFLFFVGVYVLGMVIVAASNGPNAYAAGYVFYWIGYDAIYLILDIFIADTTGLRNRAFAFAFSTTPFICTAFTGPLAGQSFLKMTTWRWAIGAFCLIMPVVFAPLAITFKFYQLKAEKMGLFVKEDSGRTALQSLMHYIHEFDIVGAFLLMAAFVLFLLPFSLQTYGKAPYSSATFIAMVVIGICLFPVFALWEKFFARTHFVRWELFKKRTVLGASCLAAVLYFSFYSWDQYFFNFCIVVYNLNVSEAGYMTQIYNVGSCFFSPIFGLYIRYTRHFKYAALFFALPLMILGAGLMIHFRGQDGDIGYIVMCQIFIACAGGMLVVSQQIAVMAAADRDGVPMMLSILGLCNSVGGAIGYAVSAAIYGGTFPKALLEKLPPGDKDLMETIYVGGYLTAFKYPPGTPIREAINYAWGYSQKYGAISATAVLALAIPAIAMWKNYNVDRKQNKGQVI